MERYGTVVLDAIKEHLRTGRSRSCFDLNRSLPWPRPLARP
ncbi:MAG: hypothetical protein U0835_12210 [Isosphaeraceae bacterium]